MSWPDDPYAFDELLGQCSLEAYELLHKGKVPLPLTDASGAEVSSKHLTYECASKISNEVARRIVTGDLSDLEGDKLGGVQLYETRKVTEAVKATLTAVVADFHAKGALALSPHHEKPEGAAASEPCTERYLVDVYTSQGRRSQMEDKHIIIPDLNAYVGLEGHASQAFFAVYDGHGGVEAAKFAQAQLHHEIASHPAFKDDILTSIKEGFLSTDKKFLIKSDRDALSSGATAVCALIRENKLYIAWLGDSQAMLCKGGVPQELMQPHKPEREDEKKRIEDAGGVVVWYGAWRVNGVLSVARAIGDKKLKQYVIGTPDITTHDLDETCDFLILACDGLWDVMDREKVTAFVSEWRSKNSGTEGIAKALVEHCIGDLSASDNVSIIVVFLNHKHDAAPPS